MFELNRKYTTKELIEKIGTDKQKEQIKLKGKLQNTSKKALLKELATYVNFKEIKEGRNNYFLIIEIFDNKKEKYDGRADNGKRRIYSQSPKELKKICATNCRAKKHNVKGTITINQWEEALEYFNYKCAYSGKPLKIVNIEHITAVTQDGTNYIWNIVPCEKSINIAKGNKHFLSWYKDQEFYSKKRLIKILEYITYMENKYKEVI